MSSDAPIPNAPRAREFAHALAAFAEAGAPRDAHAARVAAARLATWLDLSGRDLPRDDVRELRARLAATRDLDVRLQRSRGWRPRAWTEHLESERHACATAARAGLRSADVRGVLAALENLPALEPELARARVVRAARRALAAGDELRDFEPRDVEPRAVEVRAVEVRGVELRGDARRIDEHEAARLHRARRRFRRLRYALEWTNQDPSVAKELQDAFGALNDACVEAEAFARLPHDVHAALSAAERASLGARLGSDVASSAREALACWRRHRAHVERLARPGGRA